ncbi:MAG: hypothetical protein EOP10_00085 [Proteobacteria bacterium]|nr:MAG: hypothetical protein EOP10_00085 [Pseudomonadota bacterium]
MSKLVLAAALALTYTSPLMADTELELSSAMSLQKSKDFNGKYSTALNSTDLSLYAGYRFEFLSLGLLASQKKYDVSKISNGLSADADAFYSDTTVFPVGAQRQTGSGSGSLSGIVFGPQLTLAFRFKILQPYLRVSYQLGQLSGDNSYTSTGVHGSEPVAYDLKYEAASKANFTQIVAGVRFAAKRFYLLVDLGVETMKAKSDWSKVTETVGMNGASYTGKHTYHDSIELDAKGQIVRLGIGLHL